MVLTKHQKLLFLQEIFLRKDILFGHFDDFMEGKRKKADAWNEIRNILISNGVNPNITLQSLRDNDWKNLRKASFKKIDGMKKTGAGGGNYIAYFYQQFALIIDIHVPYIILLLINVL